MGSPYVKLVDKSLHCIRHTMDLKFHPQLQPRHMPILKLEAGVSGFIHRAPDVEVQGLI